MHRGEPNVNPRATDDMWPLTSTSRVDFDSLLAVSCNGQERTSATGKPYGIIKITINRIARFFRNVTRKYLGDALWGQCPAGNNVRDGHFVETFRRFNSPKKLPDFIGKLSRKMKL